MGVGSWFGHYVHGGYDKALIINRISQVGGMKKKEIDFNIDIGKMSIKKKEGETVMLKVSRGYI